MTEFVPIARSAEPGPGEMKRVLVDRERVLLVDVDRHLSAPADACGHQKAAPGTGKLRGTVVECPLHFACFDVTTGEALPWPHLARRSIPGLRTRGPEAMRSLQEVGEIVNDVETEDVRAYEVRIDGDTVSVRL